MSPRRLHEVAPPAERALLVGAPRKGTRDAKHAEEHLDELARLADTAGAAVVGRVLQMVAAPDPATSSSARGRWRRWALAAEARARRS